MKIGDRVELTGNLRPRGWIVEIPWPLAPHHVKVQFDHFTEAVYNINQLRLVTALEQLAEAAE